MKFRRGDPGAKECLHIIATGGALKSFLLILLAGYLALVAIMYLAQRALMYFPETLRVAPAAAGFAQAQEVALRAADGTALIAWHVPPQPGKPLVLYFHGNGASLRYRVHRFLPLVADGTGLVALSYRGYGGSAGRPSEEGLIADAQAAYEFARARHPDARLVLWGESLGSGVAIALATERAVGALILEAPFTSAADIGAAAYPFLPVRLLMKDPFRSDLRIGRVRAPILILHGARDRVVPISFGERLFALANEPKRMLRFDAGAHEDLDRHGALTAAREFLAEYERPNLQ